VSAVHTIIGTRGSSDSRVRGVKSRSRGRQRPIPEPVVRTGLTAGGKEIRTVGPAVKEKPFRRAIRLLFARTYGTFGLADETGTSRIKKFTLT
jgi:hypothetical protein